MSTTVTDPVHAAQSLLPLNEELHLTQESIAPLIASTQNVFRTHANTSLSKAIETFLGPTLLSVQTTLTEGYAAEVILEKETAEIFHALAKDTGELQKDKLIGRGQFGVVHLFTAGSTQCVGKRAIVPKRASEAHAAIVRQIHKTEQCMLWALHSKRVISIFGVDNNGRTILPLARGDLRSYLPNLNPDRLNRVVRQALEGIAYLQERNVVSRDIKTDNFLVIGEDVVIADLGFARFLERLEKGLAGSPMYMAPEGITGKNDQSKVDMWSLGATIAELLKRGKGHLFPERVVKQGWDKKPRESVTQPVTTQYVDLLDSDTTACELDPTGTIRAIARRILIVNPDERPSARKVLADFRWALHGHGPAYSADSINFLGRRSVPAGPIAGPAFTSDQINFWGTRAPERGFIAMNAEGEIFELPVEAEPFALYLDSLDAQMLKAHLQDLLHILRQIGDDTNYEVTPEAIMLIEGKIHLVKNANKMQREPTRFEYLPPEYPQINDKDVHKKKMWQLGAVLYHVLAGEPLVQYQTHEEVMDGGLNVELRLMQIDDARAGSLDPDGSLRNLLEELLREDPLTRPTAVEVLDMLTPPPPTPTTPHTPQSGIPLSSANLTAELLDGYVTDLLNVLSSLNDSSPEIVSLETIHLIGGKATLAPRMGTAVKTKERMRQLGKVLHQLLGEATQASKLDPNGSLRALIPRLLELRATMRPTAVELLMDRQ